MKNEVLRVFGVELDEKEREESYSFIERFIEENVEDWSTAPDTNSLVDSFWEELKGISKNEFAFLLSHSGYIPEFYSHDSSQETLYSKLVEVLLCEWAIRVGFDDSTIQTQKASKEDVTIKKDSKVIVSDAKSFRLGRSQGAPNVKDVIKKADYKKWLENYPEDERSGGLLPFPILHSWKNSSDVFSYCSDKNEPIIFVYYQDLAFMLLAEVAAERVIEILENYEELFPSTVKSRKDYFSKLIPKIFEGKMPEWKEFERLMSFKVIPERVRFTIKEISEELKRIKGVVSDEVNDLPEDELRQRLIESEYHNASEQLQKNLVNIRKFRPH